MNGKRARFHTMTSAPRPRGTIVQAVMVVLLLALAMQASDVGATDLEDAYTGHQVLCDALGGTVDKEGTHEHRTNAGGRDGAVVKCNGSIIGGYQCELIGENGTLSHCHKTRTAEGEDIHVAPGGGIEDVSEPDTGGPEDIGGIAVQPGSAEDPTGDAGGLIERQVLPADQAGACEALGGTAKLIDQPARPVSCTGGILDGMDSMICYGTICDYFTSATGSEDDPSITPAGGSLLVSIAPGEAPAGTTGASVTPVVGEDPTGGETMVIMNQSGPTVGETTKGQGTFCRGLGGTSTTIESWPDLSIVQCEGGLLDGMTCFNSPGATNCMFVSLVVSQDPQVTPAAGIEAPAESVATETAGAEPTVAVPDDPAAPTVAPTELPVEPTIVPTDVPVEPTAAPTEEPVLPTVPTDDNTAPPGEAEDPTQIEPTPTEVVLL